MLKVQSLLPGRSKERHAGIQTDLQLPKVKSSAQSQSSWLHSKASFHKINISTGLADASTIGLNSSLLSSQSQSYSSGFYRYRKQAKGRSSEISTKNFRFLDFNENTTKQLINRYLQGRIQFKKDEKNLYKQIGLPYFRREDIQSSLNQDVQPIMIDIPEIGSLLTNLKQIIEITKTIYGKKYEKQQTSKQISKKVTLTVLRIVAEKRHLQVTGRDLSQCLQKYLQKYIDQIEREKKRMKYGSTNFLNRFYQEIYQRYQQVPFRQPSQPLISQNTNLLTSFSSSKKQNSLPPSQQKQSISRFKKKATMNESFIKMRFYDNFRKQVEVLSSNTQHIINKQSQKMNKIPEL